jgi:hypothetical protein
VTDEGQPGSGPAPSGGRFEWPFLAVVVLALAGVILVVALDRFRRGSVVFAAAFGLAAVCRLVLPESRTGLLSVRSKPFDLAAYTALAISIAVLALAVPGDVLGG